MYYYLESLELEILNITGKTGVIAIIICVIYYLVLWGKYINGIINQAIVKWVLSELYKVVQLPFHD